MPEHCDFCHESKDRPIHSNRQRLFLHEFDVSVSVDELKWRADDAERGVKP
jgi:hypothetical protein